MNFFTNIGTIPFFFKKLKERISHLTMTRNENMFMIQIQIDTEYILMTIK